MAGRGRGFLFFKIVTATSVAIPVGRGRRTFGCALLTGLIFRGTRRSLNHFFFYGCRLSTADGGKGPPETSTSTGL